MSLRVKVQGRGFVTVDAEGVAHASVTRLWSDDLVEELRFDGSPFWVRRMVKICDDEFFVQCNGMTPDEWARKGRR